MHEHHYYHDAFFGFGCYSLAPVYATAYPVYVPYTVEVPTPVYDPAYIGSVPSAPAVAYGDTCYPQQPAPYAYSPQTGVLNEGDVSAVDGVQAGTDAGLYAPVPQVQQPQAAPEMPATETVVEPQAPPTDLGAGQTPAGQDAGRSDNSFQEMLRDLMVEGTVAFAEGDYEKASRSFLEVAMAAPENIDALLAYAVARFATGDYAVSAIAIRRGVRTYPDIVNAPFDIRDRYGQMTDFDRHLKALEAFLAEHSDDFDAWVVLGFVQHFTLQRAPAGVTFRTIKERSPNDADLADAFLAAKPVEEVFKRATQQQAEPRSSTSPAPQSSVGLSDDAGPVPSTSGGLIQIGTQPALSFEPAYEIPGP